MDELNKKSMRPVKKIPDEFLCPLTGEFMEDPVRTTMGQIYDKKNIEDYFAKCADPSVKLLDPFSRVEITDRTLESLSELKKRIDAYRNGNATKLYQSAHNAIENKEYSHAKEFFEKALKTRNPGELTKAQI